MAAKTEAIQQQPKQGGTLEPTDCAIRLPEVLRIYGKSKTSLYEDMREGRFPSNFPIGKRARAWSLVSVMSWLESQKAGV